MKKSHFGDIQNHEKIAPLKAWSEWMSDPEFTQ